MTSINVALTRVMLSVSSFAARLRSEERGQDLLEYALLGGLIAIALVTFGALFTPYLTTMATNIGQCIDFTDNTPCMAPLVP